MRTKFSLASIFVFIVFLAYISFSQSAFDNLYNFYLGFKAKSLNEKLRITYNNLPTQTGKNLFLIQSQNLTKPVDKELVDLDSQIISCDSSVNSLLSNSPSIGGSCVGPGIALNSVKGKFLGGQCCGALKDTKEYHEQLQALKKYSYVKDIPLNPYKTPVELAKKWIDYDNSTNLTAKEQGVYDEAMNMSKEKGPCCCKCWHYYVNEGIAKKLIKDFNFNSKQIADYWDVSDICGS